MSKMRITESDLRLMVNEAVRRVVNEGYMYPRRPHGYDTSVGMLMVNGRDFVERVLDDCCSDEFYERSISDPAVQEIAGNEYKVTAVYTHQNQTYDDPEIDDFSIEDDEGLFDVIENIGDENLRTAFMKGYEKYVEGGDFRYPDYDDDF